MKKVRLLGLISFLTLCFFISFGFTCYSPTAHTNTFASESIYDVNNSSFSVIDRKITFDIRSLPEKAYESAGDFLLYDAKVTATYTYKNHTNMDITTKLFLPVTQIPDYGILFDEDFNALYPDNLNKHSVSINNALSTTVLRHTLPETNAMYDYHLSSENLPKDNFIASPYNINKDTPVIKLTYLLENTDKAFTYVKINTQNENDKFLVDSFSGTDILGVQKNRTFTVYALNYSVIPNIEFTTFSDFDLEYPTNATVSLIESETSSLLDTLLSFKRDDSITDMDWYNAQIQSMYFYGKCADVEYLQNLTLSRWLEYSLFIPANDTAVVETITPIYPFIDYEYEPASYVFCFKLPVSQYLDEDDIDIDLITPLYIEYLDYTTVTDHSSFWDGDGYELEYDDELGAEISFALSETESEFFYDFDDTGLIIGTVILLVLPIVFVGAGLLTTVLIVRKDKKKFSKAKENK